MPAFRFAGPGPFIYPETRDAQGRNVSQVEPGDVREFEQAPDHDVGARRRQQRPGTGAREGPPSLHPSPHPTDRSRRHQP